KRRPSHGRDDRPTPRHPSRPPGAYCPSYGARESTPAARPDQTRSKTAPPGSEAHHATAPRSTPATAARDDRQVAGASRRRSRRPSADPPDRPSPRSWARARRYGQASLPASVADQRRRTTTEQKTSLAPFESS